MQNFGTWIASGIDSESQPLRDFKKGKADWPNEEEFGKYADYIAQKETDEGKRRGLLQILANSYRAWGASDAAKQDSGWKHPGFIFMVLFGLLVAGIILVGIYYNNSSFVFALGNNDNARGLITFLFGFSTIALFIFFGIATFWVSVNELKDRFDRAKDILGLIIGIFGTILGFYFGSLGTPHGQAGGAAIVVSAPLVSVSFGDKDKKIVADVIGGKAPLIYEIKFTDLKTSQPIEGLANEPSKKVENGKIEKTVTLPDLPPDTIIHYSILVRDADGVQSEYPGNFIVGPKPAPPVEKDKAAADKKGATGNPKPPQGSGAEGPKP